MLFGKSYEQSIIHVAFDGTLLHEYNFGTTLAEKMMVSAEEVLIAVQNKHSTELTLIDLRNRT